MKSTETNSNQQKPNETDINSLKHTKTDRNQQKWTKIGWEKTFENTTTHENNCPWTSRLIY